MTRRRCSTFGVLLVLSVAVTAGISNAAAKTVAASRSDTITGIGIAFKLDPRLSGATYGGEHWVAPSTFMGATAQDTVEARARGLSASGASLEIAPEWVPSDTGMLTVSPIRGDQVKIKVLRAGESTLRVTALGYTKELLVRARYLGNAIQVEIAQPSQHRARGDSGTTGDAKQPVPDLETKNQRVGYAVGMNLAKALQKQGVELDEDALVKGFTDTLAGGATLMTEEQARATLTGVQTDQRVLAESLERKALGERNEREGKAFLVENRGTQGVVTLPSGLQYKVIKAGEGRRPTASDVVTCHYRGSFIDGKEFDNKLKAPVTFPIRSVMKGWSEALQLMPVGSTWQIFVPAELAYGERGAGGGGLRGKAATRAQLIGPNSTLIFELELIAIEDRSKMGATPSTTAGRAQDEPPSGRQPRKVGDARRDVSGSEATR
jgi:FKBP-type peptidyl-prolyl cis-trans isomerase FklB